MTPKLSVCINCLNDSEELIKTIQSIRETSPRDEVEIIVVDDCSTTPVIVTDDQAIGYDGNGQVISNRTFLFRTSARFGCGPTRHMASEHATAPLLLFVDAHMRFVPGWYEAAMERTKDRPTTMHCAQCLGLNEGNMDVMNAVGAYNGAELCLFKDVTHVEMIDRKTYVIDGKFSNVPPPPKYAIFEGKWASDRPGEDDYELSCVMGACYFIPREFFFKIGGLSSLRMWGSDEPFLSLKVWLAGGDIRMMKTVKIGHKFRSSAPYSTPIAWIDYNKVRSIMTVIKDPDLVQFLVGKFPASKEFAESMRLIESDREEIHKESKLYRSIFVRNMDQFFEHFNMENPLKAEQSREAASPMGFCDRMAKGTIQMEPDNTVAPAPAWVVERQLLCESVVRVMKHATSWQSLLDGKDTIDTINYLASKQS